MGPCQKHLLTLGSSWAVVTGLFDGPAERASVPLAPLEGPDLELLVEMANVPCTALGLDVAAAGAFSVCGFLLAGVLVALNIEGLMLVVVAGLPELLADGDVGGPRDANEVETARGLAIGTLPEDVDTPALPTDGRFVAGPKEGLVMAGRTAGTTAFAGLALVGPAEVSLANEADVTVPGGAFPGAVLGTPGLKGVLPAAVVLVLLSAFGDDRNSLVSFEAVPFAPAIF